MLREEVCNLLISDALVIAHQTNCSGVMGAGVAKQIKRVSLDDKEYVKYKKLCAQKGSSLLGTCQLLPRKDKTGHFVANLFGEDIPTGKGLDTNYDALHKSFLDLKKMLHDRRDVKDAVGDAPPTIAIPAYIGCGLAGGNWDIVYRQILLPLFADSEEDVVICYLPEAANRLWEDFRHIPWDVETGCILQPWHDFPAETGVSTIFRYFKNVFDL